VGRLDVLVDQAGGMEAAHGPRDADRQAQERADLHRRADQPSERLAARVLEDEDGAAPVALEPERPNGPSRIELGRQRVLVLETRQGCGRNVLARRSHDEHTGNDAVCRAGRHGSVQDELAILVEQLERTGQKIDHPDTTDRPRLWAQRYQ
jgi:hypothetical protein